jgi:N-acetylmuramoyl-L-alanine amidase
MKIILDNGHGSNTKGKRSPEWQGGVQLLEWSFNRDVVERITHLLMEAGHDFEVLVPEVHDIPIMERVERANEIHRQTPSILVSVHGNAAPNMNNGPHGIETFHFSVAGGQLAQYFQKHLVGELGWRDRGVKKAYQRITINAGTPQEKRITVYKIAVLKYTEMLAVLTENGFYTNFDQCQKMMDPEIREKIALAHVRAINEYLSNLN